MNPLVLLGVLSAPGFAASRYPDQQILPVDPIGGEEFATSMAAVGDVDGDGYGDLLVGSHRTDSDDDCGFAYL